MQSAPIPHSCTSSPLPNRSDRYRRGISLLVLGESAYSFSAKGYGENMYEAHREDRKVCVQKYGYDRSFTVIRWDRVSVVAFDEGEWGSTYLMEFSFYGGRVDALT